MSEYPGQDQERAAEFGRISALNRVIEAYYPEDRDFFGELDFEGRLGAVYGQLQDDGEDADSILAHVGVLEGGRDDEV